MGATDGVGGPHESCPARGGAGGIQWRFQARILVRKEVKGATVLMCTHVATGQADGVEEAHARCPEVKSSSRSSSRSIHPSW